MRVISFLIMSQFKLKLNLGELPLDSFLPSYSDLGFCYLRSGDATCLLSFSVFSLVQLIFIVYVI